MSVVRFSWPFPLIPGNCKRTIRRDTVGRENEKRVNLFTVELGVLVPYPEEGKDAKDHRRPSALQEVKKLFRGQLWYIWWDSTSLAVSFPIFHKTKISLLNWKNFVPLNYNFHILYGHYNCSSSKVSFRSQVTYNTRRYDRGLPQKWKQIWIIHCASAFLICTVMSSQRGQTNDDSGFIEATFPIVYDWGKTVSLAISLTSSAI